MDIRTNDCLNRYRELAARVDVLLGRVRRRYPADIVCHKGCECGCRNLSILPVEALSVFLAVRELPATDAAAIRQRAQAHSFWECPLLEDRFCGLYPFRPIICRTHGYPLQTIYNRRPSIGYCRHNFKNWPAIPHDAIIDLDWINSSLRAINAPFAAQRSQQMPDRLSISAAVEWHRFPA